MIPQPNGRTLYAHQVSGAEFLLRVKKGMLCDDMGLGKTAESLAAAKATGLPVVVICPASLVKNWHDEALMFNMRVTCFSWAKFPDKFYTSRFVLIGDECHFIQTLRSLRSKRFLALAALAEYVWCVTGTPMKNGRPANLFPLLKAIGHPLSKQRSWFEIRYCGAAMKPIRVKGGAERKVWDNSGARNVDELAVKIAPVMLRRTKLECLDLPEKTRILRQIDITAEMQREYDEVIRKFADQHPDTAQLAMVALGAARQAASKAKIPLAIELAEEVLSQRQSVVLFTEYKATALALSTALGCELITGDVDALTERPAIVGRFQNGQKRALVLTTRAGGVGITLTRAQTVILVDRAWTPGDCSQMEDRLHRIGQKNAVTAIWLQAFKIDEVVDKILLEKTKHISELTGEEPINFIETANAVFGIK